VAADAVDVEVDVVGFGMIMVGIWIMNMDICIVRAARSVRAGRCAAAQYINCCFTCIGMVTDTMDTQTEDSIIKNKEHNDYNF